MPTSDTDTSSDMVVNRPRPVLYAEVTISTSRPPNVPDIEPSQYEEIKPHNVDKEVSEANTIRSCRGPTSVACRYYSSLL